MYSTLDTFQNSFEISPALWHTCPMCIWSWCVCVCVCVCACIVVCVHTHLCVLEIVSPEGSDFVLATHIPNSEADVLVFHCLHIET